MLARLEESLILSDRTISDMLAKRDMIVEPISPESIQPASVDCRLGNHYLIVESLNMGMIKMSEEIKYREVKAETLVIPPQSFLLATTQEYFEIPDNVTAFVEGRSSVGRMGLFIQNAGWVDPGFKGQITLELFNANSIPIELAAGRRICQLVFCRMDQSAAKPYHGKYQGQRLTTGSRISSDHDRSTS